MDAINPNTRRSYKQRGKWGAGGKKAFERGDRSGGQEAFIDLFNRLAAQYGAAVPDFMIGNSVTPFSFLRAVTLIQDDLDLWFEATGQRVSQFTGAERLALECWLWETPGLGAFSSGAPGRERTRKRFRVIRDCQTAASQRNRPTTMLLGRGRPTGIRDGGLLMSPHRGKPR